MKSNQSETPYKAGFVAIVGKPNVGKSTLINQLVGQKVSITANKPQTTRQNIRGIKTTDGYQIIFVDTPGIKNKKEIGDVLLNQRMNKSAMAGLRDADLILFITDINEKINDDEQEIVSSFNLKTPVFCVINKSDMINDDKKMIELLKIKSNYFSFTEILPVSAFNGTNLKRLNDLMVKYLPVSKPFYDHSDVTDAPLFRRVEEMIREKCMRDLHHEIPFKIAISVNRIDREDKLVRIQADIWVDSQSHKKIVVGARGEMIKSIGIHARYNLEKNIFHKKVYLQLFVKIQKNWFNRTHFLDNLCI